MAQRTCDREGCERKHYGRGLCRTHYNQTFYPDRHPTYTVTCEGCGVEHQTPRKNGKYCSLLCRDYAKWGPRSCAWPRPERKPREPRKPFCWCEHLRLRREQLHRERRAMLLPLQQRQARPGARGLDRRPRSTRQGSGRTSPQARRGHHVGCGIAPPHPASPSSRTYGDTDSRPACVARLFFRPPGGASTQPQEGVRMSENKPIEPPSTLGAEGKRLWDDVVSKYVLRADELRTLEDACSASDMLADLSREWVSQGRPYISRGSMGQEVEHPLIGSIDKQRKARQAFIRQLKLPDDPGSSKPNQQRQAAQSRWAQAHGASA